MSDEKLRYVYGRPDNGLDYHGLTGILATHEALKSAKTSSLPLVSFWRPEQIKERIIEIEKALSFDVSNAELCFEYATSLPPDVEKFGRGKASMTDLMIILRDKLIACEAKYSEYVKDKKYRPTVASWLKKENKDNRSKVIAGWRHLIGNHMPADVCVNEIPYQLVHRVASACADRNRCPCVLYHLFYDDDGVTQDQAKEFSESLKFWVKEMRLTDVRFVIAATKVEPIKNPPTKLPELFLWMDKNLYGDMQNTEIWLK